VSGRRAAGTRPRRFTEGQIYTMVIGLVCAAALIAVTLPPVLDSRNADSADASTPGSSSSPAPVGSTQGLTDDTIKIGVVMLDLSAVAPLGLGLDNYEVPLQKAAFEAYFKLINNAGGINGRRIVPVYASTDVLATTGPHSDPAICVRMAKDEKVFAVIGYPEKAGPCLAVQHSIPVILNGSKLEQEYRESHNYLIGAVPSIERTGRLWARALVDTGVIEGHHVGLLSVGDGGDSSQGALAAATELADLDHPVTLHSQVSPTNAIADVQVAVQKMKQAGIDQVMLTTSFAEAVQFTTFAQDQKFYPQYLTSGLGALAADGLLRSAPPVLDGAIGFNSGAVPPAGEEETPDVAQCRQEFNDGTDGKDLAAGEENSVTTICGVVDLFVRAATNAGKDLTTQTFVDAVEHLKDFTFPGLLGGTFGPGKTDFADGLQPVVFSSDCKCYQPSGDPIYLDDVS
jgi:ABC-type branched-subunit amino acid transport system substrate-binding protein